MKKIFCLLLCIATLICLASCNKTDKNEFKASPAEFVKGITAGWNLGNTLDACQSWGNISNNPSVDEQETGWNNPVTTKKMIDFVSKSGFNAVRLPVTWYLQTTEENGKYTIKKEWLNRVKEVANYCLDNDMYTIVNMHHDDQYWLDISKTGAEWTSIKEQYKQMWQQIAEEFKNCGEKLILEGANEITYKVNNEQCWWGHDDGTHLGGEEKNCFKKQNELYQIFVDTVRASGGNNDKRYLMLPTYGAQWYEQQIKNLVIPNNDEHIIMDIHWYKGSTTDEAENRPYFETMKKYAEKNKTGVVIGECGAVKSMDEALKSSWAEVFVKPAKELGIPCFLWDDGGDLQILERNENPLKWNSQSYVDAVLKAAKGANEN